MKLRSIDDQNHAGLTLKSLRATIGLLQDNRPYFHYIIGISGILPYKHVSRSLETFFRLCITFARLYNAAASPASRPRSAGSLAIIADTVFGSPVPLKPVNHDQIELAANSKYGINSRCGSCSPRVYLLSLEQHTRDSRF